MEVKYNLHVVELRVTITRVRNNQWQTLKEEDIEMTNYEIEEEEEERRHSQFLETLKNNTISV